MSNAFVVISDGANNKYGSSARGMISSMRGEKINSDDKELDGNLPSCNNGVWTFPKSTSFEDKDFRLF